MVTALIEGANVFTATATDTAGNVSAVSNAVTLTLDTTAPAVSITSASGVSGGIVSSGTLRYTATFSEVVTGFELSDITLAGTANGGNPAASNLQGAGAVYTFDVQKGSSDGSVTVSIAADAAMDSAGHSNTASNDYSLTINTESPAVSITSISGVSGGIVSSGTLSYTATFSVAVTGFEATDITVAGTANGGDPVASNLQGTGAVYTFDVARGSSDGSVIVSIAADVAQGNGQDNIASNQHTLTIDTSVPAKPVITTEAQSVNPARFTLRGTADMDVTSVELFRGIASQSAIPVTAGVWEKTITLNFAFNGANVFTVIASDAAGNVSAVSDAVTITRDATAPLIVSMTSTAQSPTSLNPIPITVSFSEPVTGLDASDITVTNGTVTNGSIQSAGASYAFGITPTADGTITVNIPAAAVVDAAGNPNTVAAPQFTITSDRTPPTVAISTQAQTVSTAAFTLAGTTEAGATTVDVLKDGMSIGAASVTGINWTFDVTLTEGANAFTATATDTAGNTADATVSITLDTTTAPSISISPNTVTATAGTAIADITITSTGDDVVSYGIDPAIGNGLSFDTSTGTISGTPDAAAPEIIYTITATNTAGTATATVAITVEAAADTTAPVAPLITLPTDDLVTEASLTLSGSAEVGASIQLLRSGTAITSATIDADTNGDWSITFDLTEGDNVITATASDAAGNVSAASAAVSITLDTTAPAAPVITTAVVTPPSLIVTTTTPFTVTGTAEAGAEVAIFRLRQIRRGPVSTIQRVPNGTVTADNNGDWTAPISLTEGVSNFVAVATDAAGNVSADSIQFDIKLDTTAPTVNSLTSTAGADGATVETRTLHYEVAFGEFVSGFTANSITVGGSAGGSVTSVSGDPAVRADFYEFDVEATNDGSVIVSIAAGAVQDIAGTGNIASSAHTLTIDAIDAPSISISPATVTVMAGTAIADITITSTGDAVASYSIDPAIGNGLMFDTSTGTISGTPDAAAEAITYTITATNSGGSDTATVAITVEADTTPPAVAITTPAQTVNADSLEFHAGGLSVFTLIGTAEVGSTVEIFRENVSHGSAPVTDSGTWTKTVTVFLEGTNEFKATATDTAGNTADATVTITRDTAAPTVAITTTAQTVNEASFTLEGTVEAGATVDVLKAGNSIGTASVTGINWTFATTLTEGANAFTATATDTAGNTADATAAVSITLDSTTDQTKPTIQITSAATSPTNTNPIPINLLFSEPLTGFAESDISVSGGVITAGSYEIIDAVSDGGVDPARFTITPSADGLITVSIAADAAQDSATNGNPAASFDIIYDGTAPSVSITSDSGNNGDTVNAATLSYTATFSEDVTGFEVGGITVTGTAGVTSATNFVTVSTTVYTFDVFRGDPDGTVIVSIAKDSAMDSAGNGNTASGGFGFTIRTPLTITSMAQTVNVNSFTLTGTARPGSDLTVSHRVGSSSAPETTLTTTTTNWEVEVTLLEGDNRFEVARNINKDDTTYSNSVDITLDSTAPAVAITTTAQAVNDAAFTLTGTVEAGATVDVLKDGTSIGAANVTDTTWSLAVTLTDGANTFTATASDGAMNTSTPTDAVSITLDTTLPDAPVITQPTTPTNDNTIAISGTAEAGATVTLSQNGNALATTATANSGGAWSLAVTLIEGANTFTATASDAAGNVSAASAAVSITLNTTTAPMISISPATVTAIMGTAITPISITSTGDDVDSYSINPAISNGLMFDTNTGIISGTPAEVADAIPYTITATNSAGMAMATVTITVEAPDTTPPAAPVITTPAATPDHIITATTLVTVNGTAEAGALVEVYSVRRIGSKGDEPERIITPRSRGSVTADNNGNWMLEIDVASAYHVATATDAAGNVSAYSNLVFIDLDTTPPPAPLISTTAQTVNTVAFTISGSAEAKASIQLLRAGNVISGATAKVANNRQWSITFDLEAGANDITATATDRAGHTSVPSAAVSITLDTTAPAQPVITTATPQTVNDATFTLTGTVEAGATVDVLKDGASIGAASVTGTDWTFATTLTEGANLFTATASDAAGNVSAASAAVSITLNTTTAPIISISPATVTAIMGTAITPISITSTGDDVDSYSINPAISNGLMFDTNTGTISGTPDAVADAIPYTITATNSAGMAMTTVSITVEAPDTTPPAPPVITTPVATPGEIITTTTLVTVNGTAEAGALVEVYSVRRIGSKGDEPARIITPRSRGSVTADNNGNWMLEIDVASAYHVATATDAAGNVSAYSNLVLIDLDTTPPAAPLISTTAQTVNTVAFTISGSAEAKASIQLLRADNVISGATAKVANNRQWSITFDLEAGANDITATATDRAGHTSVPSATVSITLDTTAPAQPVITTATPQTVDTATFTLEGTTEAGATVTLSQNGNALATTATANSGGAWSLAVTLTEGTNTFTATASDAAGNVSVASAAVSITLNTTTAPMISISPATVTAIMGTAITPISITSTGDDVDSYSINPAISNGLMFDTNTGIISGTPAAVADAIPYTITATNSAGMAMTTVSITVEAADTTQPSVTISSFPVSANIVNGDTVNATTLQYEVIFSELVSGFDVGEIRVTGTAAVTTASNFSGGVNGTGRFFEFDVVRGNLDGTVIVSIAENIAEDAAGNGNTASGDYTLTIDTTPPTITLNGDAALTIVRGTTYTDAGATANDNIGGDITGSITRSFTLNGAAADSLNSSLPGTYIITYNVSDAANNPAMAVTRMVTTVEALSPNTNGVIATAAGDKIRLQFVDQQLTNNGAAPGDFSLSGATAAGITVTALAVDADDSTVLILSLSGNIAKDAVVTLAYTRTAGSISGVFSTGSISSNGIVIDFTATTVDTSSIVAPDQTEPTIQITSTATSPTNANPIPINLTFSEPLTGFAASDITVSGGTITAGSYLVASGDSILSASFTITPSADGLITVRIAADAAQDLATNGNLTASFDITYDGTAPVVTISTQAQTVNDAAFMLSGTVEAGATVTLTQDGTALATTATVDSSGGWTLAVTLTEGANLFTATAGDAAGNVSAASAAVSITLNSTTAPMISISQATVTAIAGTAITPISITSTGDDVVSYGINPAIGNGLIFDANTGTISGTPTVAAGAIPYTITATNSGGEAMVMLTITVEAAADTTATAKPVINAPASGAEVSTNSVTLTGTASPGANVLPSLIVTPEGPSSRGTAYPNLITTAGSDGVWTIRFYLDIGFGEYTIVVTATAGSGDSTVLKSSEPITITRVRDTSLGATITTAAQTADTASFTLTGTANKPSVVQLFRGAATTAIGNDNVLTAGGTWTITVMLEEGANVFTATATDGAGNVSAASAAVSITLNTATSTAGTDDEISGTSDVDDLQQPQHSLPQKSASLLKVFNGSQYVDFVEGVTIQTGVPKFKGTSSGISSVQVLLNNVQVGGNNISSDGTFRKGWKHTPLADGTYTISINNNKGGRELFSSSIIIDKDSDGNPSVSATINKVDAALSPFDLTVMLGKTAAIGDELSVKDISISPNPTSGILNITVNEKAYYKLLNIRGQTLKTGVLSTGKSKIDISSFAKGIYLLNIKTSKRSFTGKVIKN